MKETKYLKYIIFSFISVTMCSCILEMPVMFPSIIYLKDGRTIEGKTSIITDYLFAIKDAKTGKVKYLKNEDVKSLIQTYKEGKGKFENLYCGGESILVQIIETGEINVYRFQKRKTHSSTRGSTYSTIDTIWYIMKNNEPCIKLPIKGLFKDKLNNEFYEFAQKYYLDAPELLNKIGSDGYKYDDLLKTIREYNKIKSNK